MAATIPPPVLALMPVAPVIPITSKGEIRVYVVFITYFLVCRILI